MYVLLTNRAKHIWNESTTCDWQICLYAFFFHEYLKLGLKLVTCEQIPNAF